MSPATQIWYQLYDATLQLLCNEMEDDDSLEALMARIPAHHATTTPSSEMVKCCCGRTDCAFLKHNCSALDDLEKEVRTAAQLGQVRTFRPTSWRKLRLCRIFELGELESAMRTDLYMLLLLELMFDLREGYCYDRRVLRVLRRAYSEWRKDPTERAED